MVKALGAIACIAIVFCLITSPDKSKSHAHDDQAAATSLNHQMAIEDSMRVMTDEIIALRSGLANRADDMAQRVNEAVETRFVSLQESLPEAATCNCDTEAIEARISELETKVASLTAEVAHLEENHVHSTTSTYGAVSGGSVSYGSTGTSVVQNATRYSPRWTNYDGLSKTEHARVYHGLNTSAMTADQIAMQLDADHDAYGGGHPQAMRSRSRTVVRTSNAYQPPVVNTASNGCPGGVCPPRGRSTSMTRTRKGGGLLGFGILGR